MIIFAYQKYLIVSPSSTKKKYDKMRQNTVDEHSVMQVRDLGTLSHWRYETEEEIGSFKRKEKTLFTD